MKRKKSFLVFFGLLATLVVFTTVAYLKWSNSPQNAPPKPNIISEFTGDAKGCGNITVYKFLEENNETAVVVKINGRELNLSSQPQTFTLDGAKTVQAYYFKGPRLAFSRPEFFCNDAVEIGVPEPEEWFATSGTVTVRVGEKQAENSFEVFTTTVELKNTTFESKNLTPLYIQGAIFENVKVGWLPG